MVANAAEGDKVAGELCNVISDTLKLLVACLVLKNVRSFCSYLSCSPICYSPNRKKLFEIKNDKLMTILKLIYS